MPFRWPCLEKEKIFFLDNCNKGHRFETYICKRCLDEYLEEKLGSGIGFRTSGDHQLIVQYFANVIAAILRNPEQHQTKLVERCAYYILQLQDIQGDHPIVFFLGKKPRDYDNIHDQQNLEGFTSDSLSMIALFQKEIDIFRRAVDTNTAEAYPIHFIDHILNAFAAVGLKAELESAIDGIVDKDELGFY